jgi:hypothetical protein
VTPRYRIISPVVLDDDLIVPFVPDPATKKSIPVAVHYALEPNDAMTPLNDIAREVHAAFRESRGVRTDIEKRSIKPSWMTESGLVLSGSGQRRREMPPLPNVVRDVDAGGPSIDDVSHVQVLGKTHPPFERNFHNTGSR